MTHNTLEVQTRQDNAEHTHLLKKIFELESAEKEYIKKLSESKNNSNELERRFRILVDENRIIKEENEVLQKECIVYKTTIEEKNTEIRSLLIRFREPEELYNTYLRLSNATRGSLSGIFKGTTVEEFIFCGVQLENIDSLWEFIKRELEEKRLSEVENMKKIFVYFFKAYNLIHESPIYKIQNVAIGEEFDEDKHLRSSNSRVAGRINEIMLNGFIITNTGKIVKKSVVKI